MGNFETLLTLMVVIWGFGKIFRALKLPVIFGELVGGIVVGPVLLGLVDPENEVVIILAELGVFFLMLHVGLETDPHALLKASKKSFLVSVMGIVLPMIGGFSVARAFGMSFMESFFMAVALSTTAIAISARLFKENKMQGTDAANIVLGAAVIDDIAALISFSVVLSVAKIGTFDGWSLLWTFVKIVLFFAAVIWLGLKTTEYWRKIFATKGFTFALIVALTLGLVAEGIGLHAIIGAFLAGLFIREEIVDRKVFHKIEDRIYGLSYSFLGPIFFVSLAFHLDFTSVKNAPWLLVVVVVAAILGKILGAGGAALAQGVPFTESMLIGFAMNSRGAVELIIASVGLKEGIIDKNVFSVLVIMAFTTTLVSIFAMKPLARMSIRKGK